MPLPSGSLPYLFRNERENDHGITIDQPLFAFVKDQVIGGRYFYTKLLPGNIPLQVSNSLSVLSVYISTDKN